MDNNEDSWENRKSNIDNLLMVLKKQSVVALSTYGVDYIIRASSISQAVWRVAAESTKAAGGMDEEEKKPAGCGLLL
ncbi:hypothetical protein HPP92_010921 [Vanilla planifolia]|uniref:Uncharacterized protein n=1 Tax=Vanilla planifolia TaxID=51239 RepID=A0A835R514_VANPL|nr:hypothetical protein HPP92_010921 [Vanilla planifolia]